MLSRRASHQPEVDDFRVFLYLLDHGEDVTSLAAPFLARGWITESAAADGKRYLVTPEGEQLRE